MHAARGMANPRRPTPPSRVAVSAARLRESGYVAAFSELDPFGTLTRGLLRRTPMPRKAPKTAVVAFKVEAELADILNELPNKSAFIRRAIVAQLSMACPVCGGTGVLPKGLHDHFARVLPSLNHLSCEGCGDDQPLPPDPGQLAREDRNRLEQFFHGGPFYCDDCYESAPTCDDCGWHIGKKQAKGHRHDAVE